MSKPDRPRVIAYQILFRFEKNKGIRLKADRLLQAAIADETLTPQERAFTHALVMGTLRHWFRLDAWLLRLTGRPLKALQPAVRVLLRMGLFQLYGLHQVPAYAAIDSTVGLAKQQKLSLKTARFINAVLRQAQREQDSPEGIPFAPVEELANHLRDRYGWPLQWTERLIARFSSEELLAMAQAGDTPAPLTVRVNTLKISMPDFQKALTEADVVFSVIDEPQLREEALLLPERSGSIQNLPGYKEGWFYVQDPASMWVAHIVDPQAGEAILDLCAAPGSKTTHIAALANNAAHITALDSKKERMNLLSENLDRLGVTNVQCITRDALTLDENETILAIIDDLTETREDTVAAISLSLESFDKVLVDAPCSGSGTFRRHPEILLQLATGKAASHHDVQLALLKKGWDYLKPGGALVYSTCSILQDENQQVVADFLKSHAEAKLETEAQRLLSTTSDGFYAARLRKA